MEDSSVKSKKDGDKTFLLFPSSNIPTDEGKSSENWLKNESFTCDPVSSTKKVETVQNKSKTEITEIKSNEVSSFQIRSISNENLKYFYLDKKPTLDNLLYDHLCQDILNGFKIETKKKPRNFVRYYADNLLHQFATQFHFSNNLMDFNINFVKFNTIPFNTNAGIPKAEKNLISSNGYFYEHGKLTEFNEYLNKNPNDIEKWIEFIKIQDYFIPKFEFMNRREFHEKFILDRKMEIIKTALKHNPSNVSLSVERLKLLNNVQDPEVLNNEWKNLLFLFPNNFIILENYFIFIFTNSSYFDVKKLDKFYKNYMEKIIQIQEKHLQSIRNENIDIEDKILKFLLCYTTVLKQSGYFEKSIAIWQALIEFNFYSFDYLNKDYSLNDWLHFFNVFWSSGQPIFGQKNSNGWKNMIYNVKNSTCLKQRPQQDLISKKENEVFIKYNKYEKSKIWLEIESLKDKFNWLPYNFDETSNENDSIILFEDISYCLFRFKEKSSFLNCIVYFLNHLDAVYLEDFFLYNLFAEVKEIFINNVFLKKYLPNKYDKHDQKLQFILSVFQQSISYFENDKISYNKIVKLYLKYIISSVNKHLDANTANNLFKKIFKKSSNLEILDFWNLYLDLQIKLNNVTSANKIFETIVSSFLLKKFDLLNLSLIVDFIKFKLELKDLFHSCIFGKIATLDENDRFSKNEKFISEEIICFIHSILNCVNFKSSNQINITVKLRSNQLINSLRKTFYDYIENSKTDLTKNDGYSKIDALIDLTVIQAYNKYFENLVFKNDSNSCCLKEATDIFEQCLLDLENLRKVNEKLASYVIEKVYENYLQLHIFHLKYNFIQLTLINKVISRAIKKYPMNMKFLAFLVNLELKRPIKGEIQVYTINFIKNVHESNLSQWIYIICYEICRLYNIQTSTNHYFLGYNQITSKDNNQNELPSTIDHKGTYSSSIVVRIRNLFERALTKHKSILLWRMYLNFEVKHNDSESVEKIFYRAIHDCPWSKILFMDGLRLFRKDTDLIQNNNCEKIVALMVEKNLRVRTTVEEINFLLEYKYIS